MPMSHLPAAISRAVSRSPPDGFWARLALTPLDPFLGFRFAVLGDEGCEQGVVVDVLAGADADLALPFRIGEFLVGDRVLLHALLRGVDHARAHRDAVPVAVRVAKARRDDLVELVGIDRLRDVRLHGIVQAADIDGQQHVGRAVGAFGLDALLEAGARRDDIDLDAGVLGESVDQRLDQFRLAIGVDIDLARLRQHRSAGDGDDADSAQGGDGNIANARHADAPDCEALELAPDKSVAILPEAFSSSESARYPALESREPAALDQFQFRMITN